MTPIQWVALNHIDWTGGTVMYGNDFCAAGSSYMATFFSMSVLNGWELVESRVNIHAPAKRLAGIYPWSGTKLLKNWCIEQQLGLEMIAGRLCAQKYREKKRTEQWYVRRGCDVDVAQKVWVVAKGVGMNTLRCTVVVIELSIREI